MLIRGRFPLSSRGPGGTAGIALWDHGQRNLNDEDYYKDDRDFYRLALEQKLMVYAGCLAACELEQEAHYQTKESGSWVTLDLLGLHGFGPFLLQNRYWSVHAPVAETDITDYENELHLDWSIREVREAIDFAFRVFADALVLHPGTYNTKSRRFWPAAEEALSITNNRRVALNSSLKALVNHFLYRLEEWHDKVGEFEAGRRGVSDELQAMFREFDSAAPLTLERYKLAANILELIAREKLDIGLVRYCKQPDRGLRMAMENVEPPNFIVNTAGQLKRIHSLMTELYQEGFEANSRLPDSIFDRFRPGIVLDVTHLLNSKLVLSTPAGEEIHYIFEDYAELSRPFVSLPGEYPTDARGSTMEPLLNQVVRELSDELVHVYVAGSQRTDRFMTTHDPIKPFRQKMHLHPRPGATGTVARYSFRPLDPEVELNLAEVVQVLGGSRVFLMKLFDLAPEQVLASYNNLVGYVDWLRAAELSTRRRLDEHLEEMRGTPSGEEHAAAIAERMSQARFYVRPYRKAAELGRLGYDEAGFYSLTQGPSDNVRIFATVKEETGVVWVAPPQPQTEKSS